MNGFRTDTLEGNYAEPIYVPEEAVKAGQETPQKSDVSKFDTDTLEGNLAGEERKG